MALRCSTWIPEKSWLVRCKISGFGVGLVEDVDARVTAEVEIDCDRSSLSVYVGCVAVVCADFETAQDAEKAALPLFRAWLEECRRRIDKALAPPKPRKRRKMKR